MENVREVSVHYMADIVRAKTDQVLIIDSRTFSEYNTSHVLGSVNVWSSKIRKKRLQQNAMGVQDYLSSACEIRRSPDFGSQWSQIIVYDQSAPGITAVPNDSFLYVLLDKLSSFYKNVHLLIGGFLEFQAQCPDGCEDATQKCSPLTSLSQPCLPVANVGPTRILPFLYLGSQHDANNRQMLQDHCVLYELNVSISCPKPEFVQDSHFFRIPVNDNFSEKLTPHFFDAFNFIDKVRESGGSVLVHCLAGISRSATVAIAYVMKHLHLPYEEAYRYVKNRRPTISPNINFVGQLLELDKCLRREGTLCDPSSAPASFRQPGSSPYGSMNAAPYGTTVTNISNTSNNSSFSLDYSVNNKTLSCSPLTGGGGGGVLNDVTSASCYSLSSLATSSTSYNKNNNNSDNTFSSTQTTVDGLSSSSLNRSSASFSVGSSTSSSSSSNQNTGGSNVSLTHITQEPTPGLTLISPSAFSAMLSSSNVPHCNVARAANVGLYSKSSNISTHFGKGTAIREEMIRHGFPRVGGNIPRSLSLNLKTTLEAVPGSPESTPPTPESAAAATSVVPNLNIGGGFHSAQSSNASLCTPESPFRSCETTLHSPNSLCSSLSSPISTLHSPTLALSKLSFNSGSSCDNNRQYSLMASRSSSLKSLLSANNNQGNKSPTIIEVRKSPTIMENVFDAQYSSFNNNNKNNRKDTDGYHQSRDDESNNNNNNKNYYSSTATISVAATNNKNNEDNGSNSGGGATNDGRPRSVCIIEVNTESPVTYVENCSSEPMIVRETEVVATPCTEADFINRVNNSSSSFSSNNNNNNNKNNNNSNVSCDANARNNNNKNNINNEEKSYDGSNLWSERQHKTLVPIRASASFANILDRPKILELCAPIYNAKRPVTSGSGTTALVVGDCTWQTRNAEESEVDSNNPFPSSTNFNSLSNASAFTPIRGKSAAIATSGNIVTTSTDSTQTSPTPFRIIEKSNTLGVIYDSEGTSVADSSDFNDTASEFSVMQSDSGISFQTDSDSNMPHPIPRCYSSSETHLNTRRLLENNAVADYSTRKSCSNDEVAKSWSLHKPLSNMSSQPLPISRDSTGNSNTTNNNNNNFASMNHSNWNYPGELVRCDSWSTSGLGSELSDWESLQEDANSTHCDDPMGPFDAVFSDVFPGEKSDSLGSPQVYHHVFPQLFRERSDSKCESVDSGASDKKPRHHSFKDPQQRWRQQHKQIPLARPASLPGVMGSYLAQMQPRTESGLSIDVEDGVELRSTSGRTRGPLKRSSGSRDSGTSGCLPLRLSASTTTNPDSMCRDSGTSGCSGPRESGACGSKESGPCGHRDNGACGCSAAPPPRSSEAECGGVRRNDSGYYSITTEQPPVRPGRDGTKGPAVRSRDGGAAADDLHSSSKSVSTKALLPGPPVGLRPAAPRKPLLKPQTLAIMPNRPIPYKPQQPSIGSLRQQSSPPKSPSPPKALARRHGSPQKSLSPHSKSPSPQKCLNSQKPPSPSKSPAPLHQRSLSPRKPMSPSRQSPSRHSPSRHSPSRQSPSRQSPSKSTCTSPQPRIFGASTFYLPQTDHSSATSTKIALRKSCLGESSSSISQKQNLFQKSAHCSMVVDASSVSKNSPLSVLSKSKTLISSNASSKSAFSMADKSTSAGKSLTSTTKSPFTTSANTSKCGSSPSRSETSFQNPNLTSGSSRSPSAECYSPSQDSESSTDTTFLNKSTSLSSREASVESDTSIVINNKNIKTTSSTSICSSSSDPLMTTTNKDTLINREGDGGARGASLGDVRGGGSVLRSGDARRPSLGDTSPSERKSPEKRKSRSGSAEESNKGKEKRRSCDLETGGFAEDQLKKPVSLKTGVRMAQELLQSMENIVSSELSEIRRCTAELSSRYRLKSRGRADGLGAYGDDGNTGSSSSNNNMGSYNSCGSNSSSSSSVVAVGSSSSSVMSGKLSTGGGGGCNVNKPGVGGTSGGSGSSGVSTATTSAGGVGGVCAGFSSTSATSLNLPTYRKIKQMSQFYVLPDRQLIAAASSAITVSSASSSAGGGPAEIRRRPVPTGGGGGCSAVGGDRCRSEPPFSGDEGLYRAQSCPGLPQPLLESCEGQETVPELRPTVLRLRCDRTPPAREKLLNRYSCGTLDTQKPLPTPPVMDATFESCPDFGTLRSRGCISDSSSSSSSRSSFSRMLPVS